MAKKHYMFSVFELLAIKYLLLAEVNSYAPTWAADLSLDCNTSIKGEKKKSIHKIVVLFPGLLCQILSVAFPHISLPYPPYHSTEQLSTK